MAFVVETGQGLSDATAFITVVEAKEYWDDRGLDHSSYTDGQIQAAIIRATMYLSESFHWKGYRTKQRDYEDPTMSQSLEWPRVGVVDDSQNRVSGGYRQGDYGSGFGILVPDDVIPRQLKWATAEVAYYELSNPGAFAPAHQSNRVAKTERVGPLSVTYETSSNSSANARPILPTVTDLIGEFLETDSGTALSGMTLRI
jgi:hypothetical protein